MHYGLDLLIPESLHWRYDYAKKDRWEKPGRYRGKRQYSHRVARRRKARNKAAKLARKRHRWG